MEETPQLNVIQGSETVYCVDAEGNYLGGFADGPLPPGAIVVPSAPAHASQKWLGSEWSEVPVSTTVPTQVTAAQARIALARAGLLPVIEQAVASIGGETQIWFEYALTWSRSNPHINSLGAQLGLTQTQIDLLFIEAGSVTT
jgi:hypothetical protein